MRSTLGWTFAALGIALFPPDAFGAEGDVSRVAEGAGRHGAGHEWLTEDRCGSTRVKVARGRIAVQDLVRKRTRVVRAGRSLTVRAER